MSAARKQNALTVYATRSAHRELRGCLDFLRECGHEISLTVTGGFWRKEFLFEGDESGIILLAKALRAHGIEVEGFA